MSDHEINEARARVEIITPHENNPVAEYFSSPNTPETDARAYKFNDEDGVHCEAVHADFARRLERERDEAREAIHIAESLIKPQIEREQVTPEAKPDNDKQRDLTALLRLLREVRRERDNWEQTAAHYLDGMHYYRGLVERVGEALGEAAYTQDDGGKVDSVLCAKVPELVVDLKRERDDAREKLAEAKREAENLARSIYRTEYSDNDTGWGLLESVAGVISQIDNMYAGVREQRDEARRGIHLMAQNAEFWKERAEKLERELQVTLEGIQITNDNSYFPGKDCQCEARSESECGCDVDWTPKEVYILRKENDRLRGIIADLAGCDGSQIY